MKKEESEQVPGGVEPPKKLEGFTYTKKGERIPPTREFCTNCGDPIIGQRDGPRKSEYCISCKAARQKRLHPSKMKPVHQIRKH